MRRELPAPVPGGENELSVDGAGPAWRRSALSDDLPTASTSRSASTAACGAGTTRNSGAVSEVHAGTVLIAAFEEKLKGGAEYSMWRPVEYDMGGGILLHGYIAAEPVHFVR